MMKEVFDEEEVNTLCGKTPTSWPKDPKKAPGLIDFFACKGINDNYLRVEDSDDMCSDHTMVILNINQNSVFKTKVSTLYNHTTNWDVFRYELDSNLNITLPLKKAQDVDSALKHLNEKIIYALQEATVEQSYQLKPKLVSLEIKKLIKLKRKARRVRATTRLQTDRSYLQIITKKLKKALREERDNNFKEFTSKLTPFPDTNYSLYKITKSIKRSHLPMLPLSASSGWAKTPLQKSNALGTHFSKTFKPHDDLPPEVEISDFLDAPLPVDLLIKPTSPTELKYFIMKLPSNKSPGLDRITNKILKELTNKSRAFLASLFNSMFRLNYFPEIWKLAIIHPVHKDNKPRNLPESYRPISLLPVLSKLFEKVLLKRILFENPSFEPPPPHRFKHSTIEQIHRVIDKITQTLEEKKYCATVFLDVKSAFDRLWHIGLLYKIKKLIPKFYLILNSYLCDRKFMVRQDGQLSTIFDIKAGVPQGSILGPTLFTLYASDIPTTDETVIATYADDTNYIATDKDPRVVSENLQEALNALEVWGNKWKVKFGPEKSIHTIFTLNKETCPFVTMENKKVPMKPYSKLLGLTLDAKLNWRKHILNKRAQLDYLFYKFHWLLGKHSKLSVESKLLVYKTIIQPVWSYGCQLWYTAPKSTIKMIQVAPNKFLHLILGCHIYCYVDIMHKTLQP